MEACGFIPILSCLEHNLDEKLPLKTFACAFSLQPVEASAMTEKVAITRIKKHLVLKI